MLICLLTDPAWGKQAPLTSLASPSPTQKKNPWPSENGLLWRIWMQEQEKQLQAWVTGNPLPPTLTLCVDSEGKCSPTCWVCSTSLSPGNSFGANRGWLWKHPRTTVITTPSWAPQGAQTQDFLQTGSVIQVFNAADVYTVKHIFTNKQPDNEGWESRAHKWRPHSSLMRLKYMLIYREYKRKKYFTRLAMKEKRKSI